jgi:hypothetical protein
MGEVSIKEALAHNWSGLYDSTGVASREREAARALEESRIVWGRDWDALVAGFVLGVLTVLALLGVVGWIA